MGMLFSSPLPDASFISASPLAVAASQDFLDASKRLRLVDDAPAVDTLESQPLIQPLIPGLPDEVALHCLARASRSWQATACRVSKGWREALLSSELFDLRRSLACTDEWLFVLFRDEAQLLTWRALDPGEGRWVCLPQMPAAGGGDGARMDVREKHAWWNLFAVSCSRGLPNNPLEALPFCGCSAASLNGTLYVIGGFIQEKAISRVLQYDPHLRLWSEGPPLEVPRGYCKTGVIDGKLYCVGGVCMEKGGIEPLASVEVLDPTVGSWRRLADMKFSRAPPLPAAFLEEVLRPTATGLAVLDGCLCVTQSLYHWPFFIDIGGEIYDPKTDAWTEMPQGMGEGWPVRQGGSKMCAVMGNKVYGLDPSGSRGALVRSYDKEMDAWTRLALAPLQLGGGGEEAPFLLACVRGKLYALVKDAARFTVVSSADVAKLAGARWLDGEEDLWQQEARCRFGRSELLACEVVDF